MGRSGRPWWSIQPIRSCLCGRTRCLAGAGAGFEFVTEPLAARYEPGRPARRPNILLVGMDGVNADHLSVYGYDRATSPSLAQLARDALVFTNAYSNAANTGGALTAMLTGRLPD